jgi:flagellar basal-body rod protein FlgG
MQRRVNRAMYAAASGMAAQQTQLEVVADNLANADVAGFKGAAETFADVRAGAIGLGTTALGRHALFAQGKLVRSGGPFDLAIDGPGFFIVERGAQRAYTRNGEFAREADGTLRNSAGWTLRGVRIPAEALAARVERDGRVLIDTAAAKDRQIAQLRLASFAAPEALRPLGATLFARSDGSGPPRTFVPGAHDGPSVAFGMLERSNVSIVESMMQILGAQRAYEANAKGVQAADEMLRIANNLHRG